jgi:hypothetical protein
VVLTLGRNLHAIFETEIICSSYCHRDLLDKIPGAVQHEGYRVPVEFQSQVSFVVRDEMDLHDIDVPFV